MLKIGYGLILVLGSGQDAGQSEFETTQVYLDENEFKKDLIEIFAWHCDENEIENLSYEEVQKHEGWDEFIHHHVLITNTFQ